jgi:hypothetical protein
MKIRQKISFIALQKSCTIFELFLRQIDRTYQVFVKEGIIEEDREQRMMEDGIMHHIIKNGKDTLRMIMLENSMKEGHLLAEATKINPMTLKEKTV